MARTRRIVRREGCAHYHIMSRTNDRRFLFRRGRLKAKVADLLRRSAEFSGVRLEAYCVMDDHFHAVCLVEKPNGPVPEEEVLRRIGVLKGAKFAERLAERWTERRAEGLLAIVDAELNALRVRMNDVSQFVKTFKELAGIACKDDIRETEGREYVGGIWSGRFKSTLVEDGRYLTTCIRYVEFNPVRAGLVSQSKDYAYCSHGGESCTTDGDIPARDEGSVPTPTGRVAQIGGGTVFGSRAFVVSAVFAFGHCFRGRPVVRAVLGDAFAAQGHRLKA